MLKLIKFLESKSALMTSRFKIYFFSKIGLIECGHNSRFDLRAKLDTHMMVKKSQLTVGDECHIRSYTVIAPRSGTIKIGSNVNINPYCYLYGYGNITIGDNTRIAAGCKIIAFNHSIDNLHEPINQRGNTAKGIKIGKNVWLGADVKVLDGVEIGDNCVVGAGSVVSKTVKSDTIVAGVPAQIIKPAELRKNDK